MKILKARQPYLLFSSVVRPFLFFVLCATALVSLLATGGGGDSTGHWDSGTTVSGSIPAVTSTVPLNNATAVATNRKVTATFTEAMNPATITTATFTLKQGAVAVAGTVTYSGVTAVFTPTANLAATTLYTATITTGAKNPAGTSLASNYVWTFTTGAGPDVTAPTVTSTVPANTATGVSTNSNVTATFSEAMDPLTITTTTFTVKQGATTIAGTVTYAGLTAVFTPTTAFAAATLYTATITTGAKDLAGIALAANYVWTFTTGAGPDTTRPTVTLTVPANLATGIATNTNVSATFSEAMNPLTITTLTFTLAKGATAVAGTVTYAGLTAVFNPTTDLAVSTTYTATITTGAKDLAGNTLAVNKVWTFITSPAPDTTRPTVTVTVPADTAVAVVTNTTIAATFSEAMDPLTITNLTFTLLDGAVVVPGTVDYLGLTAVFTPTNVLTAATLYTATIDSTVTDLAGNELAGNQAPPLPAASDYKWTFTTGAGPDVTAPTVNNTSPADLDAAVLIDKKINATFSEAMKPTTITSANFSVDETVSGNPVAGTVIYNLVSDIATFTPDSDLTPSTNYTATVSNQAQDLAGNALVVPAVGGLPVPNPWTFTTAAPAVPPAALAIDLGSAGTFGIASRAGLTSTGVTVVNGDVGLDPLATCTDSTGNAGASQTCLVNTYASPTGMTVNGSIYWAGDPFDGGATALAVTTDLNTAWIEGFAKVDTLAGILVGQLGAAGPVGKILVPGVYNEANLGFAANTVATFDAQDDADANFIIKVGTVGGAGDFTDSGTLLLPTQIKLINGAQAKNIWFIVGRDVTLGSGSTWNGNILAGRSVTVNDGSTVLGRVLAGANGAGAFVLTGAAAPSVTTVTVP